MTTEEKAKAYDEIIKKANKMHSENCETCQICIEELIPELRESEDERIRKAIIEIVKKDEERIGVNAHLKKIQWLEKQGEQKLMNEKSLYKAGYLDGFEDGVRDVIIKEDEQNPAWSEEDAETMSGLLSFLLINTSDQWVKYGNWLKSLKDRVQSRQKWKQENTHDLTDFENAMMHIGDSFFEENAGLDPNDTIAIKEQANILLELVPKQEWSEEDEKMLKDTIRFCELCGNQVSANWLKSLRPQSHWKPSDEQMEEFSGLLDEINWDGAILVSLYNDLEKLREE